jgi:hypothetical protein
VDIGGTNIRVGFVRPGTLQPVEFHRQRIPRTLREPDLPSAVKDACRRILDRTRILETREFRVFRKVGVSAPGAYRKDGSVYPGTVPNVPFLEKTRLFTLFSTGLGPSWKVTPAHVNNDGVLQGLVMADRYASAVGLRQGVLVALIPGTGCGAGVYRVRKGHVAPVPGPQQIFDVFVTKAVPGEPLPDRGGPARGGEPLTAEDLISGRALDRYGRFLFGRDVDGEELSRIACGPLPSPARRAARLVFQRVGEDLAALVRILRSGRYGKKHVPFRPDTRGARVFLLGGTWLLQGAGLRFSIPEARRKLPRGVCLVTADRIPGVKTIAPYLGVAGASLLVSRKV